MAGDTLLRQWLMLLRVPQAPSRRSTTEIAQYLREQDYDVTARTVQRDLEKLSTYFSYTCETEGRTNYWFFPREQRVLEIPGMSSATALALLLARDHSKSMIPPQTLSLLQPYFSRAEDVLVNAIPKPLAQWRKRIKVIERGPVLRPAAILDAVQMAVYDGLLHQQQIRVSYRARSADVEKEQVLHPVGLVLREGVLYLIATAWDYPDVRHYALHRMISAAITEEAARVPKGFDLEAYVEREFRYPVSPAKIALTLRMNATTAIHLQERPLSSDQSVKTGGDLTELTATVDDTDELRWWILGFGANVEVLKPAKLRKEIAAQVQAMHQRYAFK